MRLRKSTLNSFAWSFFQQVSNQSINFIVQILLARFLLPEDFGTIAIIQIFLNISQTLIDSGMTASLIRNSEVDDSDYSTVFYMNLIFSVVLYVILFTISPFISEMFHNPEIEDILKVMSLILVIQTLTSVQITRLTKELNFKLQTMLQVPSVLVGGVVGIILAINGFGVWSIVYMNIVRLLILSLTYGMKLRWTPIGYINIQRFKFHFSFSYKLTLSNLFTTAYNQIYTFLIARFFTSYQLGLYTQGNNLAKFPVTNLTSVLLKVTFPVFAKKTTDDHLKKSFKRVTHIVVATVAPLMIVLVVIAEPLFSLLLSDKWSDSVIIFQILCAFFVLQPINGYYINVLLVKGRSDLHLKSEVIKKTIGTLFLLLIIPFGLMGAVIAQGVTIFIGLFVNSFFCSRVLNYPMIDQLKDIIPPIFLSAISAVLCYVIVQMIFVVSNLYLQVSLNLFLFFCVYVVMARKLQLNAIREITIVFKDFIKGMR